MTAPARLVLALAALLLLVAAPAASATTTGVLAANVLELTNDGDSETFGLTLKTSGDPEYVVTTTSAPLPPVAGCTLSAGNKTLTCPSAAGINQLAINGGAGNDTFGISGSTSYESSSGVDLAIDGGPGNDTFNAGSTAALRSSLGGGANDDTFNGSAANPDSFFAEPGNDTYVGGTAVVPAGLDPASYQSGYARDRWYALAANPVNVSDDGVRNDTDGLGGTDDVRGVEQLAGSNGNDRLRAGGGATTLSGDNGSDTLIGGPADDVLDGGGGNDGLSGGGGEDSLSDGDYEPPYVVTPATLPAAGNDTLDGGADDDRLIASRGRDDVRGGKGEDTFLTTRVVTKVLPDYPPDTFATTFRGSTISLDDVANDGPTGAGEGDDVHSDVEDVDVSSGSSLMFVRSGRVTRGFIGFGSLNTAPDVITGSAAANVITTGAGSDAVDGRGGPDTLNLGDGADRANAVDRTTDVVRCGRGADSVGADLPGTNPVRADVLTGCESVTGTPLGLEGGSLPVAPSLTVGGSRKLTVRRFRKRFLLAATVRSNQPVSATGVITIAGARIARVGDLEIGSGRLGRGTGTRTLRVRVAKRYRGALKRRLRTRKQRRKGLKLRLAVTVRNAAGQATTRRRVVRVRR